jgi:hypothetical protein
MKNEKQDFISMTIHCDVGNKIDGAIYSITPKYKNHPGRIIKGEIDPVATGTVQALRDILGHEDEQ